MAATIRDNRHDEVHANDSDIFTAESSLVNHDFHFDHTPLSESAFATSDLWGEPTSIDPTDDKSEFSDDLQQPHSDAENDDGDSSDAEDDAQLLLDKNAPWNNLTKFLSEWA